ncbi:sensor histidine kinase [Halopseudomonas pelagia]|uniref:sensor histidine kinase n=1 Tax=Halopseudomonas pelagia TaxID=553151 RepID=UPI0003AA20EE|nr:HAMP domain-containing sensor histidine kinase [Halopseudomonas pelagia]|tara:strand:- start:271 stop:1548 length:1278 start_codon:yes stop_codon:yes gene_type:complete
MIRLLGLKWLALLTAITLGIGLLIGYTLLSAHSYVSGMDSIVSGQLGRAAMQTVAFETGQPIPREEYIITRTWAQQPASIREAFDEPPQQPGVLYKVHVGEVGPQGRLYFAIRQSTPAGDRFVTQQLGPMPPLSVGVMSPLQSRLINLMLIGLAGALMIGLIVGFLWRRVSRPITALGDWAAGLDQHNLSEPVPDFVYPELNRFAELVRTSLTTAHEGLEREQLFLLHTSHELRTPISVVRANLELWRKVQASGVPRGDPREAEIINRIDRASLTMKDVTETLLWLGRDDTATHPCTLLRVDQLITELVDGLCYLLHGHPVQLQVDLEPAELLLPELPTRIVLGNLIRNAFQHTQSGTVIIYQCGGCVRIVNSQQELSEQSSHTGFGLGLKLTERFTHRLGWRYTNEPVAAGRKVEIMLQSVTSS